MKEYVTEEKPIWRSKKFIAAIIAVIIPIINSLTGLDMDPAEVVAVVIPLVVYIFAQGAVDKEH